MSFSICFYWRKLIGLGLFSNIFYWSIVFKIHWYNYCADVASKNTLKNIYSSGRDSLRLEIFSVPFIEFNEKYSKIYHRLPVFTFWNEKYSTPLRHKLIVIFSSIYYYYLFGQNDQIRKLVLYSWDSCASRSYTRDEFEPAISLLVSGFVKLW